MRSKSIVQERLDASRNRLEVITREVDAQRMSVPDLSKALRQVGIYLESIQKMVKSDTNVKFIEPLDKKLEVGMNRLEGVIRAVDGSGMSINDLNANLTQVHRVLDSIQEYVDLEIEDLA
jgi:hypothetical protein